MSTQPRQFQALSAVVAGAWLLVPAVRARIGYPGQRRDPARLEEAADQISDGILDPVIARGAIYTAWPVSAAGAGLGNRSAGQHLLELGRAEPSTGWPARLMAPWIGSTTWRPSRPSRQAACYGSAPAPLAPGSCAPPTDMILPSPLPCLPCSPT